MFSVSEKTGQSSSKESPAIRCSNVVVQFYDQASRATQRVLDGLEFEVAEHQNVVLLGRSGCGKSTLLRALAGLQSIDDGVVAINGNMPEAALEELSFVFQEPALLPWRTASENVMLPLELRRHGDPKRRKDSAQRMLRTLGFSESDGGKFPPQLSGGMKMRASLARALVTEPSLLLMDEPFAALDDMLRWRLNELILEQASASPRTMVFVTHNIAEAIFLSHRIAIMNRGKIVHWFENPLPLDRTSSIRSTDEFARVYGTVSEQLLRFTEH